MVPAALTLHNYRSFAGPQRLELRPLTLLYGHNNAGKSALLRSLPLLADSAAAHGLDALTFGHRLEDLELDFESLRWKGRAQTDEHTVGVDLHWSDSPELETARFAFWEEPDWRRLLVQQLDLIGEHGETSLAWVRKRESRRSRTLTYRGTGSNLDGQEFELTFQGLIPSGSAEAKLPALDTLVERLRTLSEQVLWLRSLRPPPSRTTRWLESARWTLDPRGLDAPVVLINEPEVLTRVSAWYEEHLGFALLVEESRRRELRTLMRNRRTAAFDVDLIDTGEGLGQVLPVLTALAMAEQRDARGGPTALAIEEPEAHLHPDTQLALAQRVSEVAASARARIILETHSRYFLSSIQLAVLEGRLSEQDVVLYWVHQLDDGRSVAEPTTLTELARLRGSWPPDAFEADLDLAAQIQDLRDAKEAR